MQEESKRLSGLLKSIKADRNYEFVEPIPEEVQTKCPICLCLLKEPYMVSCCGYRFCKVCINGVKSWCPMCMAKPFVMMPDKQSQRLLDQRKVYCFLKDDGCPWEGEMCKLTEHLWPTHERKQLSALQSSGTGQPKPPKPKPACKYLPFCCKKCKLVLRRFDMVKHQSVCPMRDVTCELCRRHTCPYQKLNDHYNACPNYEVACPNGCNIIKLKCKDLKQHLEEKCPLQKVKCEYHYAGCRTSMIRREMPEHMESNTKQHLLMVSTKYQKVNANFKRAHTANERCEEY